MQQLVTVQTVFMNIMRAILVMLGVDIVLKQNVKPSSTCKQILLDFYFETASLFRDMFVNRKIEKSL